MEKQNKSGSGKNDCLTKLIPGWKCFGSYIEGRAFYTYNDKFVRDSICKSIERGKNDALNRYFESNQCEELLNANKKHLKICDNEISKKVDEFLEHINFKDDGFKLEFEKSEIIYRKLNKKELDKVPDKTLG